MTTAILATDETTLETGETATASLQIAVDQLDLSRHDAVLTLVSPRTGDHRTFRVRTVRERRNPTDSRGQDPLLGRRVVELLIGPANTEDYQAFAFVADDGSGRIFVWKRYRGHDGQKSQHERFAGLLNRPNY